ncbi:glyoxalase superfamily protein [Maricaulis sp. CAU 1757]
MRHDMSQPHLPGLGQLKAQARRLRTTLESEGNFISHSEALELIASQFGYRDWNTLHAAVGNRQAAPLAVGNTVSGRYLGQAFTGEVLSLSRLGAGERYRITLDLDTPVDVVRFDSFSSFRRRIRATIGRDGRSDSRTSDGAPHLVLGL